MALHGHGKAQKKKIRKQLRKGGKQPRKRLRRALRRGKLARPSGGGGLGL